MTAPDPHHRRAESSLGGCGGSTPNTGTSDTEPSDTEPDCDDDNASCNVDCADADESGTADCAESTGVTLAVDPEQIDETLDETLDKADIELDEGRLTRLQSRAKPAATRASIMLRSASLRVTSARICSASACSASTGVAPRFGPPQ